MLRASVSAEIYLVTLQCPIHINIAIRFITMVFNRLFSSVLRIYIAFEIILTITFKLIIWIVFDICASSEICMHIIGNLPTAIDVCALNTLSTRQFPTDVDFPRSWNFSSNQLITNIFGFHPWFYQSADNFRFAW